MISNTYDARLDKRRLLQIFSSSGGFGSQGATPRPTKRKDNRISAIQKAFVGADSPTLRRWRPAPPRSASAATGGPRQVRQGAPSTSWKPNLPKPEGCQGAKPASGGAPTGAPLTAFRLRKQNASMRSTARWVGGMAIAPTWTDRKNSLPRRSQKDLASQRNNAIRIMSHCCPVWTAPLVKGFFAALRTSRVRSCLRPVFAGVETRWP